MFHLALLGRSLEKPTKKSLKEKAKRPEIPKKNVQPGCKRRDRWQSNAEHLWLALHNFEAASHSRQENTIREWTYDIMKLDCLQSIHWGLPQETHASFRFRFFGEQRLSITSDLGSKFGTCRLRRHLAYPFNSFAQWHGHRRTMLGKDRGPSRRAICLRNLFATRPALNRALVAVKPEEGRYLRAFESS